ncbi:MAG: serine/threonine protein kinase [Polyangiaceae bacterium]|nr:serine/threonine protein kinase [Polyangiaceae bacterium]
MGTEDPYIGVRIPDGGIKLVAKIGEGGMGAVYRGTPEDSETPVAVKILHVKHALESDFVKRFKREVKILRSLTHPNTVRVLSEGEMDDGSLYIVMEYLEGRGLDVALKEDGPWSLDRAVSMVIRTAYALEEAHRLGIVHRDLKPENIFLVRRPDGSELPKLLDFGLAKLDRPNDSSGGLSLTQEGDILGTPAFMSPEQSFGESLDGRADIYSLAVILYEMVTGKLPFEDEGATNQIARYLNDPIPIDERVPGLAFPVDLWPILSRALQKLPEDRFSTAMEFAEALEPLNTVQLSIAPPALLARPIPSPLPPPFDHLQLPPPARTPAPPPRTPVPPRTASPPKVQSIQAPTPHSTRAPGGRGPMPSSHYGRASSSWPPPNHSRTPAPPPASRRTEPSSRRQLETKPRNRAVTAVIVFVVLAAAVFAVIILRS